MLRYMHTPMKPSPQSKSETYPSPCKGFSIPFFVFMEKTFRMRSPFLTN